MRRPLAAVGVVSLACCAIVACSGSGSSGPPAAAAAAPPAEAKAKPEQEAIAVEVGSVEREPLSSVYSTSATLRADKKATVTARTRGVVRQILVEEGASVEADQALAVLEDDEQRIAHEKALAAWDNQRRELERAEALHAQGLMSDETFETTRREAVEARHASELAELELSRTVIRAPFAGRILIRHVDAGATVADGTAIYDLADLDPLYADVQVPERQVAQLAAGQTVRVTTDTDGVSTDAKIERIAPAVDPSTGTVKVTIAVRRRPELRHGSFVRVGIVIDTHAAALSVPRSALVAEGHRWQVFRLKGDDPAAVELVEVDRGFEEGDRVEILGVAGGVKPLEEGDRIVITGASSLSDGATVRVMNGDGKSGVAA